METNIQVINGIDTILDYFLQIFTLTLNFIFNCKDMRGGYIHISMSVRLTMNQIIQFKRV